MSKEFSTIVQKSPSEEYLKVSFADPERVKPAAQYLKSCKCRSIKKINITQSESSYYAGDTLTIYCKDTSGIGDVKKEVDDSLNLFFNSQVIIPEKIVTRPVFRNIRPDVIYQLEQAKTSIFVCVAWFTEPILRDILEAKMKSGVEVRVITFDDGINAKNGVDFGNIPHISVKAERHGIMHQKYCVVDNYVVIAGSYNWTKNAESKNDENIEITHGWENANKYTREFLDKWNKANKK